MTWAVLATGPSLTVEQVDAVKHLNVVAVSDAYRLAPWAKAIASTDAAWWKANPDALKFEGWKFGAFPSFRPVPGVERFNADTHTNSGLLGLMVAVSLGAKRILLLGFDMKAPGKHFFGEHKPPLKSTKPARMEAFKKQFANYRPRGVEIVNCTPGSALKAYPSRNLEDCLAGLAVLAK